MEKYAFTMRLHPGQENEYCRRHATIWPELEGLLREAGVTSYTIYVQNDTVFSHLEVEDYNRLVERVAEDGSVASRWRDEAEQHRHGRRLAGAVRADEPGHDATW